MRLTSVHVQGFRSLADIGPIEIHKPTILVGHNDSGKTALLDAISYLLDRYTLCNEDRTFLTCENIARPGKRSRVDSVSVTGEFQLSKSEQEALNLPERVRLRRQALTDDASRHEIETWVPKDVDFRNLETKKVEELKSLAAKHQIDIRGATKKDSLIERLQQHEKAVPCTTDWVPISADIRKALPILLRFGNQDSAETTIKSALTTRFHQHLEDPNLSEQISALRDELSSRVRDDAEDLIRHIKGRCPDLTSVDIEPEVSFSKALKATHLHLATTDGEEVGVGRSGAGRARRVSLAIWEWTSETFRSRLPAHAPQNPQVSAEEDPAEPPDAMVLYDEPDTHLDYLQQRRVMKIIHEQCDAANVSVIVATHSMNLIDGAAVHDLVHLRLGSNGRTEIDRLLSSDAHSTHNKYLLDIAASLGLRNTVLLHERFFLAVEGDTEMQSFPILFRLATGRSMQSAGVALVACNNNEGAILFAGHLVKHGRKVAFVVDGDTVKQKFYNEARLAEAGLNHREHIHLVGLPDKELEFLFTNEQWATAANERWPKVDGQKWTDADIEELRLKKKFSAELANAFREHSESGPSGKPATLLGLAGTLESAADVPEPLQEIFLKIIGMAALDD